MFRFVRVHFYFFCLGAAAAAACCCCKRREMLGTSIAVVFGCFYFCPVDCDASVMVVGCAAVWKKKYRGCNEIRVHLDFLV